MLAASQFLQRGVEFTCPSKVLQAFVHAGFRRLVKNSDEFEYLKGNAA